MKARVALVVVLAVAVVATGLPAGATPTSGLDQFRPLDRLTARAEAEIAHYHEAIALLPQGDRAVRMEQRMLRADNIIGVLRSQAHDSLHVLLDTDVLDAVHLFDAATTDEDVRAALAATGASPAAITVAETVAADFIEFQSAIGRLRVVTRAGSPERVCPVDGETWFENTWHVSRAWGRVHKGLDMHAELGTPLVAVEDGVVIQANWHWLGGRQVYLRADSTGDVYYYAHLDYWPPWLWTGTRLEAGDYLGLAGTSGNADTPHLHLGWMPGSEEVDLDNLQNPYYLMYELCVGS